MQASSFVKLVVSVRDKKSEVTLSPVPNVFRIGNTSEEAAKMGIDIRISKHKIIQPLHALLFIEPTTAYVLPFAGSAVEETSGGRFKIGKCVFTLFRDDGSASPVSVCKPTSISSPSLPPPPPLPPPVAPAVVAPAVVVVKKEEEQPKPPKIPFTMMRKKRDTSERPTNQTQSLDGFGPTSSHITSTTSSFKDDITASEPTKKKQKKAPSSPLSSAPVVAAAAAAPTTSVHSSEVVDGFSKAMIEWLRSVEKEYDMFVRPDWETQSWGKVYLQEIQHPICIQTVVKGLRKRKYERLSDIAYDLGLIVSNCLTFNGQGEHISDMARKFQTSCDTAIQRLREQFGGGEGADNTSMSVSVIQQTNNGGITTEQEEDGGGEEEEEVSFIQYDPNASRHDNVDADEDNDVEEGDFEADESVEVPQSQTAAPTQSQQHPQASNPTFSYQPPSSPFK